MGYAVLLLSLGGLPPLPGFWGRLILFREAMATGFGYLAFIAAATSVAGLYYYVSHAVVVLRDVGGESVDRDPAPEIEAPERIPRLIVSLIAIVCLVVGLFPEPLLALCRAWGLG